MMKKLTRDERTLIAKWYKLHHSMRSIATILGRSPSTISAELSRNAAAYAATDEFWVQARNADTLYRSRRSQASKKMRLKDETIRHYVEFHLRQAHWAPEIIAGKLSSMGMPLSTQSIYNFIDAEGRHDLNACLLVRGRARRRRTPARRHHKPRPLPAAPKRSIETLPVESRQRLTIGHLELDALLGKRGSGALQNKTDRCSRKLFIDKVSSLHAESYAATLIARMKPLVESGVLKTILQDNGVEHAEHQRVDAELGTSSYFCHPYCASERGTVENRNKALRRFFPKGINFQELPQDYVEWVEDYFNNMPMKVLGFRTPNEVWAEQLAA